MFFPEGKIEHYEHKSLDKEKLKRLYKVINTNTLIFSNNIIKSLNGTFLLAFICLNKKSLISLDENYLKCLEPLFFHAFFYLHLHKFLVSQ